MENFVVSARKYRPATFGTVVGQPAIVQTLKNAISSNTLAQAFLFTGPRGIGKTTCARILAKTINCLNLQPDTEPCNACSSCKSFNELNSFNIQELDAASNNSVDDIRTLIEQVRIPPQAGRYKVYIIDEVHMLSSSAFNAFLKTLEEPPAYAKFILATTERHKILPTILSRCQIYNFKRITVGDIASHLAWVADQEEITFEEEALHVIAQKADGAMRDALSVFDQIVSFSGRHISYANVIANLNVLDYDYYFRVMDGVSRTDIPAVLLILDEVMDLGFEGHHFVNGLGDHLRNLLLCKDPSVASLLEVSERVQARYQEQSALFGMGWLVQGMDKATKADLNYRTVTNKRLHIELLLMQLCEMQKAVLEKKKSDLNPVVTPPPVDNPSGAGGNPSPVPGSTAGATGSSTSSPPVGIPIPSTNLAPKHGTPVPGSGDGGTRSTEEPTSANVTPLPSVPHQQESVGSPSAVSHTPSQEDGSAMQATAGLNRPAAPAPDGKAGGSSTKRLSIKHLMNSPKEQEGEEEEEESQPEGVALIPLEQATIQQLINQYAEKIAVESPSFATAITASPIAVTGENGIVITFSNKIAADPDHMKALRGFLREHIHNTWFRLEHVIDEVHQPAKRILTTRDRIGMLAATNPGLEGFITRLGLDPED